MKETSQTLNKLKKIPKQFNVANQLTAKVLRFSSEIKLPPGYIKIHIIFCLFIFL